MDIIPSSCDPVIYALSHMATEFVLEVFSPFHPAISGKEQETSSVGNFHGLDLKVLNFTFSHISFINIITWPHLTARETGKWNLAVCQEKGDANPILTIKTYCNK